MANSREYGTTIIPGLKGHYVNKVREDDKGIVVEMGLGKERASCPSCRSARVYWHGRCKPRQVFHNRAMAGRSISSLIGSGGDARIMVVVSTRD